jgi:hypothetical protein
MCGRAGERGKSAVASKQSFYAFKSFCCLPSQFAFRIVFCSPLFPGSLVPHTLKLQTPGYRCENHRLTAIIASLLIRRKVPKSEALTSAHSRYIAQLSTKDCQAMSIAILFYYAMLFSLCLQQMLLFRLSARSFIAFQRAHHLILSCRLVTRRQTRSSSGRNRVRFRRIRYIIYSSFTTPD